MRAAVIVIAVFFASPAFAEKAVLPLPKVIGPDVNCLPLSSIRETRVVDDKTIDFVMLDGKWYRNRLVYSCPQLGFERAFSYKTSISQLCSVDIITVLQQAGGLQRGASCGLGKFTPIEPFEK
jgi:hypothetical protein